MLYAERLARAPDRRRAVALGVVLTLALLPGFPLLVLFMYALIALRVGWLLVARREARRVAVLVATASALALPVMLAAVQLLPAMEFARASVRTLGFPGSANEVMSLTNLQRLLYLRMAGGNPFVLVPCMLAPAALLRRETRGAAAFYLLAAGAFLALAFGAGSAAYAQTPLLSLLRSPARFAWATDFCVSVASALGVQALAGGDGAVERRARVAGLVVAAAVALAFHRATPGGLRPAEWGVAAPVIITLLAVLLLPRLRLVAAPILAGAVLLNATVAPAGFLMQLLPSSDVLRAHSALFTRLRARLSPQDRVALVQRNALVSGFRFMPKTATLFAVRSINDYEPQVSRRWAAYFVMMRSAQLLTDPRQVLFLSIDWTGGEMNRRLLDLAAVRFLVVDPAVDSVKTLEPPLRLAFDDDGLRVYENPSALPRAAFVPRVEVVADATALLRRLAQGPDDPREVALVEEPLASGFAGTPGDTTDSRVVEPAQGSKPERATHRRPGQRRRHFRDARRASRSTAPCCRSCRLGRMRGCYR